MNTPAYKLNLILSLLLLFLLSCSEAGKENTAGTGTVQYTCPMHPQILQEKPGTCPICGMDLVKINPSDSPGAGLMLSDSQMKLANITTQKAGRRPIGQTITVNGRLAVNEQNSEVISSRAEGRIEKLYIKETGQALRAGQPLYILYSETLLTLQHEYLLAKEQYETLGKTGTRYRSFLDAARKKLLLYGLTKSQIDQLTDRTALRPSITFLAPSHGVVTEINATEGQYVSEGSLLYKIEDISRLWVEAELYPGETSLVKTGDQIVVSVNGNQNKMVGAKVIFLSPEYRANTQITVLRATLDNPENEYKPGQQAQIHLTHSTKEAIAIPSDAVIRDGNGTHVYVQTGNNTFQPRMVKTGIENFNLVEITEGLNEGDTVAVTGAYLLYSELILKKGTDPMAGHNH